MNQRRFVVSILAASPMVLAMQQPTWSKSGNAAAAYVMVSTTGSAMDRTGATLTLRSDTAGPSMFGTITASIPADSFRGRRVRIVADIDAQSVTGGASAWIRADGPAGVLVLDNGSENALRGTTSAHRETTLYVPNEATRLVFGLLLTGSGQATARGLRVEARPPVAPDAPLAPVARVVLDSSFAIVRRNALWRDTVTWAVVEPRVRAIAAGAETGADVYPAIRALLTSLGDHHSFHMRPSATRQFQTGGAQNPRPEIRALPDSIGYISVPAYAGADAAATKSYVTDVYSALRAMLPQTSCRWVVDLRRNGGGNMWPMLAGLRPLLGEAGLGSFVSATGPGPLWRAKAVVDLPLEPALTRLDSAHVAVLTGPQTASSGEAVTISFIGRPRTRSFGLATRGLSTANQTFPLPDSSMILLTVSVEADRNGVRYGGKIDPDESIPVDSANGDVQLSRAVAWLKSRPSCGS
jgi:C-terminal processing protease CtpA/Prc